MVHAIFDEVKSFIGRRKKAYAIKIRRLILLGVLSVICVAALANAISDVAYTVAITLAPICLAAWAFLKIRRIELATIVQFIRDALDRLLEVLKRKEDELRKIDGDPAKFSLNELLSLANDEERKSLEAFTGIKFEDPNQFDLAVRKKATHDIVVLLKRIKGVDRDLALASYSDMLDLAGEKFKQKRNGRSDREFESHLVRTAFDKMVETMNEKDRKLLEHEIANYAEKHLGKKGIGFALTSGGMIAAELGGFATYTMASSVLAGISSTFGIGLPFAAYTTLSSTLSALLGPVGLIVLASWGLHKITSPNTKTTILVVLAVASIRERLLYEYPQKRDALEKEILDLSLQISETEMMLARVMTTENPQSVFLNIPSEETPKTIEHQAGSKDIGANQLDQN